MPWQRWRRGVSGPAGWRVYFDIVFRDKVDATGAADLDMLSLLGDDDARKPASFSSPPILEM